MSAERILSREEKALKSATGALVEAVGGTKIALRLLAEQGYHPSSSLFYGYGLHTDTAHFMPVHYVAVLERAAGRPIVTAHMAAERGADVVPAPEGAGEVLPLDADGAVEAIRSLCRKSGGLKIGLDGAAEDGTIDAAERVELLRQARLLLGFVWRLVLKLERS